MNQILEELPQLLPSERAKVWRVLEELELHGITETPEMLAAIDAGHRSLQEGKEVTIDQARQLLGQWTSKLS